MTDLGLLDRTILRVLDRPAIKRYINLNKQRAPRYIGYEAATEKLGQEEFLGSFLDEMQPDDLAKLALTISWIGADLRIMANKVISSRLLIKKRREHGKAPGTENHPLLELMEQPNPFMTRSFLLSWIVHWLQISRRGAFLFLSPQVGNNKKIVEIWPINSNRIVPIKDEAKYVKWFAYFPVGKPPYKVRASHIVWFRYADPTNYWGSNPPLWQAMDAAAIETGLSGSQKKFYTQSRNIPLSVVSVSPDIGESDFAVFRADLKNDWSTEGSTLAIARGGEVHIGQIGFSPSDLEIISGQSMSRDKLDSIFLGIALRSEVYSSGEGLKAADRWVNENTIHPLHIMLSETLSSQAVWRFWDDSMELEFEDIRTVDRALSIQERNIDSRWKKVNEQRLEQGMPPLDGDFKEIGEMLIPLATNPAFVSQYLTGDQSDPSHIRRERDEGHLPDTQHNLNVQRDLVREGSDDSAKIKSIAEEEDEERVAAILAEAYRAELKRWRKVAIASLKTHGNAATREFESNVLPANIMKRIELSLETASDEEAVVEVFMQDIQDNINDNWT